MIHRKMLLAAVLGSFMAFAAGAATTAATQSQVQVRTQTQVHYAAGSKGANLVARWLLDHATYAQGQMLGDLSKLGMVTVTYSLSGVQSVGGGPPVPLPPSGQSGDRISISSCSMGTRQTWEYEWVSNSAGSGWVLRAYNWTHVTSCSSGA
jgi:hypothetical protein